MAARPTMHEPAWFRTHTPTAHAWCRGSRTRKNPWSSGCRYRSTIRRQCTAMQRLYTGYIPAIVLLCDSCITASGGCRYRVSGSRSCYRRRGRAAHRSSTPARGIA
jgi:hypothetical protein